MTFKKSQSYRQKNRLWLPGVRVGGGTDYKEALEENVGVMGLF
jgi:hypothetical protein